MRMALIGLSILVAGCPLAGSSDLVCTEVFVYGLTVTLTDDNGVPITGATLTLTDGNYSETLQELENGVYVGAGERAGTYTLAIAADGYMPVTVEHIVVNADECHVIPVARDVSLPRA